MIFFEVECSKCLDFLQTAPLLLIHVVAEMSVPIALDYFTIIVMYTSFFLFDNVCSIAVYVVYITRIQEIYLIFNYMLYLHSTFFFTLKAQQMRILSSI